MITLDGYFEGPNQDISWHTVDDEFNEFAIEHTKSFGALMFGRVTYDLFESYWPKALVDPQTSKDDRVIAKIIEDIEKIVFSTTLKKVTWNNSKLFHDIKKTDIEKLKEKKGKDIAIFGSGKIVQQLANLKLIDEYRIMVNPIVLGEGRAMFENVKNLKLKLKNTRIFKNGNVLLTYTPQK